MTVRAPAAPGRLGEALDPTQVQSYLAAMQEWLTARRTELDDLDQAALTAHRQADMTTDVMLAMSLWKAVSDRFGLIMATWDGGRVGVKEREQLSSLIWGRLDATMDPALSSSGMAVSLPEACRLSDAMTAQLRDRLALDPSTDATAGRVRQLRASVERVRDQVALEPSGTRAAAEQRLQELLRRTADVVERAARGADVGGLLGPLEAEVAITERDLIVGNAQRRAARDRVQTARELRADLDTREQALTKLADTCVATVDPAPRYAVPDVDALGPVPNTPVELDRFMVRLQRVSQALTLAQREYSDCLQTHTDLLARLDGFVAKATSLGVVDHPDVAAAATLARDVLDRRPCPIKVAEQVVLTYQTWLTWAARTISAKESA